MNMNRRTKILFLRPFIFQEMITYIVLVPNVLFFFLRISEGVRNHLSEVITYILIQTVFSVMLGAWVKYYFISPAIELMGKEQAKGEEIRHALMFASILPFAEAVLIYIRWAGIGWCSVIVPLYLKGIISFEFLIFGGNILGMTGVSAMATYYMVSENSLSSFYQKYGPNRFLDKKTKVFRLNLNKKLLANILLIALPPIGNLIGIIYLSIFTRLDLASIQFGLFLILLQTVIMTFLNGILLMTGLTQSVGRMSHMLNDMAKGKGDLTKRLNVNQLDEVGELAFWFNEFVDDLNELIGHVRNTSLQLHESIEHVSAGSRGLSQATQEQAASVEEISASIEEMNGSVLQNADLIQEGHRSSNAITKLIDHTKKVFSSLLSAINEISQDSKKIGDIVTTVNEVAFHTNLLALNASVEAARAGEHGKGFAVVAGEVRSLAQRSAVAANEIKSLIESTVSRIRNGDEMMKKMSSSLEDLMNHMEVFFRMMETISTSSKEQTQNISELARAISQIDSSTQSNASTVEELASTLDNLRNAATVLAEDVRKFTTSSVS
jgi:methyl-accepting chemotaxis protein